MFFLIKTFDVCLEYLYLQTNVNLNFKKSIINFNLILSKMKKGLLSLLALALTVVGCQNYDDQFDELTSQITSLQSTVDGLTGVTAAITTLQGTVAGLVTTLGNVSTGVGENATTLETVSSTLADLLAQLEGVATNADLAVISTTLGLVQSDVRELLEGNSTINQNLTINSEATLLYAETLVATGVTRPNVIVNGTITFDTTGFSADQQIRANEIAKKIATVLDDVSITSTSVLEFEKMTFVDADLTISGGGADVSACRTISDNFQSTEIGEINYSYLSGVGGSVKIIAGDAGATNVNSITSVDFGTATFGTISVGASATFDHVINAPKATSIKTGDSPVVHVIGTSAADIDHNYTGDTALPTLSITGSGSIDIKAAKVTGKITIDGVAASVVKANSLTTTNTFAMPDKVAQLWLQDIKHGAGAFNATVVALDDFLYPSGNLDISATDVDLTGAKLIYSYGTLTHSGKGHITVDDAIAADLVESPSTTQITIKALDNPFVFGANFTELHTINITGKAKAAGSAQANLVTISAAASMTTVNLNGTIDGLVSAGNAKLKTVTTLGNLTDMTITGATALTAVNAGHSHISGDTAVTFVITGATALQSLDLSAVDKVKTITLTGNTKMTTITAPSTTTLCEAGAAVAVSVTASLSGVFVPFQPEIAATETTPKIPAELAKIKQNSLNSLAVWFDAHIDRQTVGSPTFVADSYLVSGTNKYADFDTATAAQTYGQAVAGTGSGTINVVGEINLIEAE